MKYAHALQFNAVPEWSDYYISYSVLKKIIYQVEKLNFALVGQEAPKRTKRSESGRTGSVGSDDEEEDEAARLIQENSVEEEVGTSEITMQRIAQTKESFMSLLEKELEKVCSFFRIKEREAVELGENLLRDIFEEVGVEFTLGRARLSSSWPHSPQTPPSANGVDVEKGPVGNVWNNPQGIPELEATKKKFRESLMEEFILLHNLNDFVEINYSGFLKILKKYDKCTNSQLKKSYLPVIDGHFSFKTVNSLNPMIENIVETFSQMFYNGNKSAAQSELLHGLKEHVTFDRNTIWRDMIELERRKKPAVVVPLQEIKLTSWGKIRPFATFGFISIAFILILCFPLLHDVTENRCLGLFVFASLSWATEVLPLHVTSLMIPFFAIILKVIKDDHQIPLNSKQVSARVFGSMFSHVIMLLLGGFSIAAALSKFNIAKSMAISVLSRSGTKPSAVLLANMLVATFASMWISNVAAPVLCFSIVHPILRNLPADHPFARCLIMGIALASNVGGMASPISSPQNVFAVDEMSKLPNTEAPGWHVWFAITIPLCIMCDLACWFVLLMVYRPSASLKEVMPVRKTEDSMTNSHYIVLGISFITIILWCLNPVLRQFTGEMGTIALIPFVTFFGLGLLTKEDLNNFPWNVVLLAMGGLVLGDCVNSSGLLLTIANSLRGVTENSGTWVVLAIFCSMIMAVTSLISHSVGAIVILPIISAVGQAMPDPHPKLLIFGAAMMCSGAMALPVSGFPNMTAMALDDATGKPYLTVKDFLKVGIPSTLLTCLIILSFGYGLMILVGF